LVCFRTDWAAAKVVLGDSNFLKQLYEYDKDNIPDALLKKVKKYIENPKFTPEAVERVSKVSKVWQLNQVSFLCPVARTF
jgi:dynein heavy chain